MKYTIELTNEEFILIHFGLAEGLRSSENLMKSIDFEIVNIGEKLFKDINALTEKLKDELHDDLQRTGRSEH